MAYLFQKLSITWLSTILCITTFAQSQKGITGRTDTSFTTYGAYSHDLPNYPGIRVVTWNARPDVEIQKDITYCTLGKRTLVLDVFRPKDHAGNKGHATGGIAFIMVHGGGWRSGNRAQHYPLAQALAQRGYVCFTPEYRLSTEALFPAAVYDLKAAIRWVRAHAADYGVDAARVVVGGFSAGGELAAFLGVTGNMPLFEGDDCNLGADTRVNAVVDIDGILAFTHPESGEDDDSKSTSAATYWFGYARKDNPGLWNAASPLTYAGPHTPPTLFLNSSAARMHAGRDDYNKILNGYGIYTEVHRFEDAPHCFPLYYPWFDPMVGYIDGFIKKVFPNN